MSLDSDVNIKCEALFDWHHLYQGTMEVFTAPINLSAQVVHGFGRGSKELGIPTANLDMEELGEKGDIKTGIYYGLAELKGEIYETVVSVGWNPFYKNEKKTIEAHLLNKLDDFYGSKLTVLLRGYLRDEANFNSIGKLFDFLIVKFVSKQKNNRMQGN